MDALQLTSATPQQSADAPAAGGPIDAAAAGVPAYDSGAQQPLDFKALLARIKTPQLKSADATLPATSPQAPENDALRVNKSQAAGDMEPDPAILSAALPFVLLPAAPAAGDGADAQALKTTAVVKSASATAPPIHNPATPQLRDTEIAGKEKLAADFAVSGEYLPHMADANRRQTTVLSKEWSTAPMATSVLQPVQAAVPTAVSVAPAAVAQVSTPVGTAGWGNEVGQRMVWMVREKQHVAELHLNPPHLGPLDITLKVDGAETTAVFTSPHAAVREVIMAELPRLREVLADSGITLGNASVTADTPRDGTAFASQQPQHGASTSANAEADLLAPQASAPVPQRIGLVDLFA